MVLCWGVGSVIANTERWKYMWGQDAWAETAYDEDVAAPSCTTLSRIHFLSSVHLPPSLHSIHSCSPLQIFID